LPLLKNDITGSEPTVKMWIHSSNMQSGLVTVLLEISGIVTKSSEARLICDHCSNLL